MSPPEQPSPSLALATTANGDIALKLTAVLLVIRAITTHAVGPETTAGVIAAIQLASPRARRSPLAWAATAVLLAIALASNLFNAHNHEYVLVYWAIACAVCTWRREAGSIAKQARWFLVAAFGFALLWKLIGGDYLDGSFVVFVLNDDPRFQPFVTTLGAGVDQIVRHNFDAIAAFRRALDVGATLELQEIPGLKTFGVLGSYWLILVEALLVATFVASDSHKLARYRDATALAFLATTLLSFAVHGFASLVVIWLFTIAANDRARWLRATYLAIFGYLQVGLLAAKFL